MGVPQEVCVTRAMHHSGWWFLFVAAVVGLTVLGLRWTRPPSGGSDLQRADQAQSGPRADAKTVRERVFSYVTMYGPKH